MYRINMTSPEPFRMSLKKEGILSSGLLSPEGRHESPAFCQFLNWEHTRKNEEEKKKQPKKLQQHLSSLRRLVVSNYLSKAYFKSSLLIY